MEIENFNFNGVISSKIIQYNLKNNCTFNSIIALTENGDLYNLILEEMKNEYITNIKDTNIKLDEEISIVLSRNDSLCGIVNTYGLGGVIVDLESKKTLLNIVRGDYHIGHCEYPLCFFEYKGKTYLIHGTEWNRLDITDPYTGKSITERQLPESPEIVDGVATVEKYLDYFHSSLSISPNNKWIIDNGWIWMPIGQLFKWSMDEWIEKNIWESEDGKSKVMLDECWHFWDRPICWIEHDKLAVWGLGNHADDLKDGIKIYDLLSNKVINTIEGITYGNLAYKDGILFSFTNNDGTMAYDFGSNKVTYYKDLNAQFYFSMTNKFILMDNNNQFTIKNI